MYTRLNQSFHTNRKLRDAGLAATGAYACLLSYCAGDHSDGEIPEGIAEAIATPEHLASLNEFELVTHSDGYWHITGYLSAGNQTRKEWERERKRNAKKSKAFRDRQKKSANASTNGHHPEETAEVEDAIRL